MGAEMTEIELSADQEEALRRVEEWYRSVPMTAVAEFCDGGRGGGSGCPAWGHTHGYAHDHPVMSLGGLAGTGKTTITGLVVEWLGARVAYCTPTHKAASVLRRKLGAGESVSTYHSMIYYPRPIAYCARSGVDVVPDERLGGEEAGAWKECGVKHSGECVVRDKLVFERREVLAGYHHLVVVDEASMLSEAQVEDIRSFGVPVLLVGDHGQLPPVKAEMNPWIREPVARLEVNHRQGEGSSIVDLAHRVRAGERVGPQHSGAEIGVLSRAHHYDAVMGLFSRFECGPQRIIITWRNATRAAINAAMREHKFQGTDVRPSKPLPGDRIICLRGANLKAAERSEDGHWSAKHQTTYVHNGELGTVLEVGLEGQRGNTVQLVVQLDGERPAVWATAATHQLGEPAELARNDQRRPRGEDWSSWDYGYAITAHKSQGSEWRQAIVIDEGPYDYSRWVYTALTRASEAVIVVKW